MVEDLEKIIGYSWMTCLGLEKEKVNTNPPPNQGSLQPVFNFQGESHPTQAHIQGSAETSCFRPNLELAGPSFKEISGAQAGCWRSRKRHVIEWKGHRMWNQELSLPPFYYKASRKALTPTDP